MPLNNKNNKYFEIFALLEGLCIVYTLSQDACEREFSPAGPVITQQNGRNLLQKLKTGLVMNFPTACCIRFESPSSLQTNTILLLFFFTKRENTVIICTTTEEKEQIKENPTLASRKRVILHLNIGQLYKN